MGRINYLEEYLPIGEIPQYLLHLPGQKEGPVLLFLHGGPGVAESNFAFYYRRLWGDDFTVVHWDQRGAGKTYIRNRGRHTPALTLQTMLSDLTEVVQLLKARYGKQKLVLLGHSWGSVLGSLYALSHPEDISLYIGVSQFVNMAENNLIACQKLKECILLNQNVSDGAKLQKVLKELPTLNREDPLAVMQNISGLLQKYGFGTNLCPRLAFEYMKSHAFNPLDLWMLTGRMAHFNRPLCQQLRSINLFTENQPYAMPVAYILGGNDYQTATPLAKRYFETLHAPQKTIEIIPGASHNAPFDQPVLFANALHAALQMAEE